MKLLPILVFVFAGAATALADEPAGWPVYGGDPAGTRYSAAGQITPENIGDLEVAWVYSTGEIERRGEDAARFSSTQNTPTLVAGHLIVCTPFNRIIALDPATGEERWVFDPEIVLDREVPHYNCRGVAQWTDPDAEAGSMCSTRILFGTNHGALMAIDSGGRGRCPGFADNGELAVPVHESGPQWKGEWRITSAPAIMGGLAVTGTIVMDNARNDAPRGTVFAFDARTGELAWTFDPVPRDPADPAYATWEDDSALETGAANVWSTIVVDEARDLVFIPTSSAAPDHWGGERKGNNLYSSSIVALQGSTGEVVWHFQLVHHDIWDYDVSSPPMLIDIRQEDGTVIPAVVQNTKQGFSFVFNRETGEPVFGVEERPVPQLKVEGEWLSPTQPFPVKPEPLLRNDITPDDAWGFTFWDQARCREKIEGMRNDGMYTPIGVDKPTILVPGHAGGMNWGGPAWDPERQWMIVNFTNVAQAMQLIPRDELPEEVIGKGIAFIDGIVYSEQQGTPYGASAEWLLSPLGAPCNPPPWGELAAIDMVTGDVVWRSPLGSVENDTPVPMPVSWNLGQPNVGGPVVTAGGVAFLGASRDLIFRGYAVETGEEIWRHQMEAGIAATPMTYEADGRQYVVIVTGNHLFFGSPPGDKIYAFALPKRD